MAEAQKGFAAPCDPRIRGISGMLSGGGRVSTGHPGPRGGIAAARVMAALRPPRRRGHAGQLHPAVIERVGLPKGTCAVELDLDAVPVVEILPAPRVSPFPAVFQDLSLVVEAGVPAQAVIDAVRDGAGDLLEDVSLFDVYTGPQIGAGRKSLTLALRFRAADRTLTEDEASAARDAALAIAGELLGAQLRG